MSLTLYKQKRKFDKTPEPEGKEKSSKTHLRFVVQKHDASHLHYDFRLEMQGVLKSWAVPKGPSLNPVDKRLAMMVEDHPYDYRDFEGVIPEGNYGGGTVIVWDEGFYEPLNSEGLSRKEQEKLLIKQLHAGSLKIKLHGQKLKGEFALVLMKGRGERSWILIKHRDEFASEKAITDKDRSVKTGKSMIEVAADNGTTVNHPDLHKKSRKAYKPDAAGKSVWKSNRGEKASSRELRAARRKAVSEKLHTAPKSSAKSKKSAKSAIAKSKKPATSSITKSAISSAISSSSSSSVIKKSVMPKEVVPSMAGLVDHAFDDPDWLYEIKWDGYRAIGYIDGKNAELISRNLNSFTDKYAPVTAALKNLGVKAVVDGEIIAVNEKGMAVFQSLQNWQNTPVNLQYSIFDIIWLDGYDLTRLPLLERKKILKQIIPDKDEVLKFSDHIVGSGKEFFDAAVAQGLEGIMAKRSDSIYRIGARTDDWLKIKVNMRQEVVIAGFTEPRNSRKNFGSLMLGVYEKDELVYVGHTGSGFDVKGLEEVYAKLKPLIIKDCPFNKPPKANNVVTWVKPKLVCEIKFSEWTKDRIARHPIFMGLRTDKKPKEVKFEKTTTIAKMKKTSGRKATSDKPRAASKKATSEKLQVTRKKVTSKKPHAARKSSAQSSSSVKSVIPTAGDQFIILNKQELKLTNPDKPYWKKEGFTKGDMINYYLQIAPYIMPYMKDRPQSMNRHPNGIDAPNFFQKDTKGKVPEWMEKHIDFSESTNENVEYLVCSNEATLIYMANSGCIEMNPWHSRTQSVENPDWCLIDLDPDKKQSFDLVMDVAKVVKQILDSIGAEACCKTSGSKGIHIYIPLGAKYDYDQSKQLAELIVTLVNHELPDITSLERSPAKRKGKLYLDYLQNRDTQTAAAPYSLRPKPGVPVSTPVDWSELKKGLTQTTYNAKNIFDRLKTEGDLFKPVLGKGINLEKVLGKLGSMIG